MTKNEIEQQNYENMFSTCQENMDTLIKGVRRTVPHYHQSITNVQQEYLQACENMFDMSIKLQEEHATKMGMKADIPKIVSKTFQNMTKWFVEAASIQNQMILAAIDTMQENIQTFSSNTKTFSELNRINLQS